jgi:hypothetical protein
MKLISYPSRARSIAHGRGRVGGAFDGRIGLDVDHHGEQRSPAA